MTDTLSTLIDALQADDPDRVESATNAVLDEFETRRQREDALEELAVAVDGRTPDRTTTPEGTAAEQLQVRIVELEQERLALDAAVVGYLGDETAASEAIDQAQTVAEATERVDAAADDLTTALDDSDRTLPPVLSLAGPEQRIVSKGADVSVTYTLQNLGGSPTAAGKVSLDESFPLSLSSGTFAALDPDSQTDVLVAGAPTENGVFETRLTANAEGSSASESIRLVVAAKADYLTNARDQAESLATTISDLRTDDGSGESGNGPGNSGGNGNGTESASGSGGEALPGLENKAETVVKRLSKLLDRIESGRANPRAIDNKITSAQELTETITTQLNNGETSLTPSEQAVLRSTTTDIIDSLQAATNADL